MKSKTFSIKSLDNKLLNGQTLTFEGDLGINNAYAITKTIQTVAFRGDTVTIHLKSVEKLDITFIQIIRALRIALENDGKKTKIITDIPQEIEQLLKNAGFNNTL